MTVERLDRTATSRRPIAGLVVAILSAIAVGAITAGGDAVGSPQALRNNQTSTEQPWPWTGWEKFPSLYFAAEADGYHSAAQLAKMRNFSLVILEFRMGQFVAEETTGDWANGNAEAFSEEQCRRLGASARDTPPCLVYRSGMWAGSMYKQQLKALKKQQLMLRDARLCQGFTDYPLDIEGDPPEDIGYDFCRWDFRKKSTRGFYGRRIVGKAAKEKPIFGVFFDNAQSVGCDEAQHLSMLTDAERADFAKGTLAVHADAAARLHKAGKYSIISTTNSFAGIGNLLPFENACPAPEDDLVEALGGVPFARNNEFWMWNLADTCSAQIRNGIRETELGIPMILHTPYFPSGKGCLEGCIAGNGSKRRFNERQFLEFSIAAFLVAMGQGSYFGFSDMESDSEGGGWFDVSWPYYEIYDDLVSGTPLGPPTVSANGMSFSREFANGSVSVDCSTGDYEIDI